MAEEANASEVVSQYTWCIVIGARVRLGKALYCNTQSCIVTKKELG